MCVLETGEHAKPEYLEYGIDPALNTYDSTYEKAIILLAHSISENYQDNGDSKKK